MIWIIGGTSEASLLVNSIKGKIDYIVTCATEGEREFLDDPNLMVSRLNEERMEELIKRHSVSLVVDVSHPYAVEVTKNARTAAEKCSIKYIRYVRKKTEDTKGAIHLNSFEECVEFLKEVKGCVFFTTGSKNVRDFESVRGDNRYIYRILPAVYSIEECSKNGVKIKDIIACLGPFSADYNASMFKEYAADYIVMKDSGSEGGTLEKLEACRSLGKKAVIIGRQEEEGISDLDKVVEKIMEGQ